MGVRCSLVVVLSTLIIQSIASTPSGCPAPPPVAPTPAQIKVDPKVLQNQNARREITKWEEMDPKTKKVKPINHDEKFKSIALISNYYGSPHCSGVSIAPPDGVKREGPWVLTSAHCIWDTEDSNGNPQKAHRWLPNLEHHFVRFGVHSGYLKNAYAKFRIAEAWIPSKFDGLPNQLGTWVPADKDAPLSQLGPCQSSADEDDYDFAILRLVTADPSQPVQPKVTALRLSEFENKDYTLIRPGYSQYHTEAGSSGPNSKRKKVGKNRLNVFPYYFKKESDQPDGLYPYKAVQDIMGWSLHGDSGSPFIDAQTDMVVGILRGPVEDGEANSVMKTVTKEMKSQIANWMNDDGRKWSGTYSTEAPPQFVARKVSGDYYHYDHAYDYDDEYSMTPMQIKNLDSKKRESALQDPAIIKWMEVDSKTKSTINHKEKFKSIAHISRNGVPYCSGVSIVPPDGVKRGGPWVLTAAHCIWNYQWGFGPLEKHVVRFGVHSDDVNDAYAKRKFRIAEAWIPAMYGRPGQSFYTGGGSDYDFAILRLVMPDESQPSHPKVAALKLGEFESKDTSLIRAGYNKDDTNRLDVSPHLFEGKVLKGKGHFSPGNSGSPFIDAKTEMVVGILSRIKGIRTKAVMVAVTKEMTSQIANWMNDDARKWTGPFATYPPPKFLARKVTGDYYDYDHAHDYEDEDEYSFYDKAVNNLVRAQKQMSVAQKLMRLQSAKRNRNMYR